MYFALVQAHKWIAYLFLASTLISLILALVTALGGPRTGLLRVGRVTARMIEPATGGLVALSGIVMWVFSGLGWDAWFLYSGLLVVVASGVLGARGTKPTLALLAAGQPAGWRWAAFAGLNFLLVLIAFGLMEASSRW